MKLLSLLSLSLFSAGALAWTSGDFIPHKFVSHHHGTKGDWFPDYSVIASIAVSQSGRWSDLVSPTASDIVVIQDGTDVFYDSTSTNTFKALVIHGSLTFSPTNNTHLTVGTLLVESNGVLHIKPDSRSFTSRITFSGSLNTNEDPSQVSIGLLTIGGHVEVAGTAIGSLIVTTDTAAAGSNTVGVSTTDGWLAGDELVFPDQQKIPTNGPAYWNFQYSGQTEIRTISAINGTNITLSSALTYNHGATWVGHLTRNVIFEAGQSSPRGHLMFAGHSFVDFRNAEIRDCGRTTTAERHDTKFSTNGTPTQIGTNQRGRYAWHSHHVHEPFICEGNVVRGVLTSWGSERLAIVNHNSRGDITRNIVVGAKGSGIFMEDGVEMGTVTYNLIAGKGGGSGLADDVRFGALNGEDLGSGGFALWARGPLVKFQTNYAAGFFSQAAFAYFTHGNFISGIVPDIPGNPTNLIGQYVFVGSTPIQSYGAFDGNIFRGMAKHGLEINYQQTGGTVVTNVSLQLLNGDGIGLHVIHCNELILENCSITGIGTISWGAYNNNGVDARLTVNGGMIAGHYIGAIGFPNGGKFNGVSFSANAWNVAILTGYSGSGLTDLLGYSGNWRLYTNAQPGSVLLSKIYGHALARHEN